MLFVGQTDYRARSIVIIANQLSPPPLRRLAIALFAGVFLFSSGQQIVRAYRNVSYFVSR